MNTSLMKCRDKMSEMVIADWIFIHNHTLKQQYRQGEKNKHCDEHHDDYFMWLSVINKKFYNQWLCIAVIWDKYCLASIMSTIFNILV